MASEPARAVEGAAQAPPPATGRAALALCAATSVVCVAALMSATPYGATAGRYAPDLTLRLAADALRHGHLALQPQPFGGSLDWSWGRGGLYSPWGLGVPVLRALPDAVYHAFGEVGFPDRVLFLAVYAVATALLCRGLQLSIDRNGRARPLFAAPALTAFAMLFPTFVALVDSRFDVYEEVIAYACVWTLGLVGLLLAHAARPGAARLASVAGAAAFLCWIRPTAWAGAGVATALALVHAGRAGVRRRVLLAASLLALAGPGGVLVANAARFSGPLDFGYRSQTTLPSVIPGQWFGAHRYRHEGPAAAGAELFGALFLMDSPHDHAFHHAVPLQSATPRLREYYFAPSSRGVLAALVAGVLLAMVAALRPSTRRTLGDPAIATLGVWSVATASCLVLFFARLHASTSRYLSEFHPALAMALVAAALLASRLARRYSRGLGRAVVTVLAGAGLFLVLGRAPMDRSLAPGFYAWRDGISADAVAAGIAQHAAIRAQPPGPWPDRVRCADPPIAGPTIDGHRRGWEADCRVPHALVVALPALGCVDVTARVGRSGRGDGLRVLANGAELAPSGARPPERGRQRMRFCDTERLTHATAGLWIIGIAPDPPAPLVVEEVRATRLPARTLPVDR